MKITKDLSCINTAHRDMNKGVKNKTAGFTTIRLSPELCKRIDTLRDEFEFRVSRASFTETLIDRGIAATEQLNSEADKLETK